MKLRNKKTGEIWDIGKVLTNDYPSYDTLEQITEDFEDYNPPLIKNEKIRKAVKAWAEANDYEKIIVREYDYDRWGVFCKKGITSFVSCETGLGIPFFNVHINIKTEVPYTITELCEEGEE